MMLQKFVEAILSWMGRTVTLEFFDMESCSPRYYYVDYLA
jgi:hypothetical protein